MEQGKNIFEHGSTWLRADFHLHTQSDDEFPKSPDEPTFVASYVDQLLNTDTRVGVITNHNKFNKDEFKRLKRKASQKEIGLFPGVEFSLREGIHILIVFDEEWYKGESDDINGFLQSASYGIKGFDKSPYPNSRFDLKETVEALDVIGHDYFIVCAHPDDDKGLFTLKGNNFDQLVLSEAFQKKVLGLQKSGSLDSYRKLSRLINRELACVHGTDNAKAGIEGIGNGTHKVYLKVGDFSFEALKYALTDPERIRQREAPDIKNSYIKSLTFEGGFLSGETINFSPGLNSFIGIRGSGKSSILEVIRYTLGISLDNEFSDYPTYKNSLIERALSSGGKVIMEIVNGELNYRIEKAYGEKEDIYLGDVLQSDISIDAIFNSQPIYFGQKDLSRKDKDDGGVKFEEKLIERLTGSKFKEIRESVRSKSVEIERIIQEISRLENRSRLRDETKKAIDDNEHKLQVFKDRGVEERLREQTGFEGDLSKIKSTKETIGNFQNGINTILDEYQELFSLKLEGSKLTEEEFKKTNEILQNLKSEVGLIKKSSEKIDFLFKKLSEVIIGLDQKRESLKDDFAKIKREIDEPNLSPDHFLNLNRQITTAKLKLTEIEKSESKRIQLLRNLDESLVDLNNFWRNEFELLNQETSRINEAESKIKIKAEPKGNRDQFKAKLKEIGKGSRITPASYDRISEKYTDFMQMYKDKFAKLNELLTENQLHSFKKSFAENWVDLLTYRVPDSIEIYYDDKPLKQHSLGQQASAIILFLLAQKENDILIIDQPEDDLDNQTIYKDVIKEIKKLKGEMQFIFATHNANIPVLGDSEKVIACSYIEDKKIEILQGSIDNHNIQHRIVDVMEGGNDAFKRRKDIYSIWKVER